MTFSVTANPGNSELMEVDHGLGWNQATVSQNKPNGWNWG